MPILSTGDDGGRGAGELSLLARGEASLIEASKLFGGDDGGRGAGELSLLA
jgi:hypothetical protein